MWRTIDFAMILNTVRTAGTLANKARLPRPLYMSACSRGAPQLIMGSAAYVVYQYMYNMHQIAEQLPKVKKRVFKRAHCSRTTGRNFLYYCRGRSGSSRLAGRKLIRSRATHVYRLGCIVYTTYIVVKVK